MSAITTHILDTAAGKPAAGVKVTLERESENWQNIAEGVSDQNGRISDLLAKDEDFVPGNYRLTFDVGTFYREQGVDCFFPQVTIDFVVADVRQHYHVPLLLSPFGYSTYRGS